MHTCAMETHARMFRAALLFMANFLIKPKYQQHSGQAVICSNTGIVYSFGNDCIIATGINVDHFQNLMLREVDSF